MPSALEALRNFVRGTPETEAGKSFMMGLEGTARGLSPAYAQLGQQRDMDMAKQRREDEAAAARQVELGKVAEALAALGKGKELTGLTKLDFSGMQTSETPTMLDRGGVENRSMGTIARGFEEGADTTGREEFAREVGNVALPSGITPEQSADTRELAQRAVNEPRGAAELVAREAPNLLADSDVMAAAESAFEDYRRKDLDPESLKNIASELVGSQNVFDNAIGEGIMSRIDAGDAKGAFSVYDTYLSRLGSRESDAAQAARQREGRQAKEEEKKVMQGKYKDALENTLPRYVEMVEKIAPSGAIVGTMKNLLSEVKRGLNIDDPRQFITDTNKTLLPIMAKGVSQEVGNLARDEQRNMLGYLITGTEPEALYNAKLQFLRKLVGDGDVAEALNSFESALDQYQPEPGSLAAEEEAALKQARESANFIRKKRLEKGGAQGVQDDEEYTITIVD